MNSPLFTCPIHGKPLTYYCLKCEAYACPDCVCEEHDVRTLKFLLVSHRGEIDQGTRQDVVSDMGAWLDTLTKDISATEEHLKAEEVKAEAMKACWSSWDDAQKADQDLLSRTVEAVQTCANTTSNAALKSAAQEAIKALSVSELVANEYTRLKEEYQACLQGIEEAKIRLSQLRHNVRVAERFKEISGNAADDEWILAGLYALVSAPKHRPARFGFNELNTNASGPVFGFYGTNPTSPPKPQSSFSFGSSQLFGGFGPQ